jgi:two-component system chemotaxis response regulator CheY
MQDVRLLIVDDSAVMRKIIERTLRQVGLTLAKVLEASNGSEAIEVLKVHPVDLILSDISMPVMDGLEFLRQRKTQKLAEGVPVVMITTEGSENHVLEALTAGANNYLRKPFTAEQMKERVLPLLAA